jgi:hypothetical protein
MLQTGKRMHETASAPSRFPVRAVLLTQPQWLAPGIEEGNGIFYAPDKWKANLEMSRGK